MALTWIDVNLEDEMLTLISSDEPETCGGQTACTGAACTRGIDEGSDMG